MTPILLMEADILAVIGQDVELHRVAATNGGEYAGPCPFCGGRDRFRVWPQAGARGRFWCRQCGVRGDAIDYIRLRRSRSFAEAVKELRLVERTPSLPAPSRPQQGPPGQAWQDRARDFIAECISDLWAGHHPEGLAWLRRRGLSDEIIWEAQLGLNVRNRREELALWGIIDDRPRSIWLPRGIVIPWEIDGKIWQLNIRRPAGDLRQGGPKYIRLTGSRGGLYGVDRLQVDRPAMIVEGEIDALTVLQAASDLVTVVATGSTGGGRHPVWIARLALASIVLVAFDADEAGEKASAWWLEVLHNAKRWRSYWGNDVNEFVQTGGDIRAWVSAGLPD